MNTENQEVIDQICDYAEANQIKEMLQEYLKRIILTRPGDPVSFLIKSILEDPYVIPETQDDA
eukprot:gene32478-39267_t